MKGCTHTMEVLHFVKSGQWPHGCAPALREHVEACTRCAEEVRVTSAFLGARTTAMHTVPQHSAELLWWKAQLQRRRIALEHLERPWLSIAMAAATASLFLLMMVLAAAWKDLDWSRLAPTLMPSKWNPWIVVSTGALLAGFFLIAGIVGLEHSEERKASHS